MGADGAGRNRMRKAKRSSTPAIKDIREIGIRCWKVPRLNGLISSPSYIGNALFGQGQHPDSAVPKREPYGRGILLRNESADPGYYLYAARRNVELCGRVLWRCQNYQRQGRSSRKRMVLWYSSIHLERVGRVTISICLLCEVITAEKKCFNLSCRVLRTSQSH